MTATASARGRPSPAREHTDSLMRVGGGGWRIADILLEGAISRVALQRSDFRNLIAGADASALMSSLEQKVADLSGGSLDS